MDIGKINLTQYPEVGRGLTLQEEEDLLKLQMAAEKMHDALKVLLHSSRLKPLQDNDRMAFKQAKEAVQYYEDNLFHL
jgi:hypothetical protein